MHSEVRENFCNHFLTNQDSLIALIEASIDEKVDKLLSVTIFLDEKMDEVLECVFSNDGKLTQASIKLTVKEKQ